MLNIMCQIKSLTKAELAAKYGFNVSTLIKNIKPVNDDLQTAGYTKFQKIFTPRQVKIIVEHMGEY